MDNKKTTYVTIALSILLFLVFLFAQQALHRENSIVLPEYTTESETEDDSNIHRSGNPPTYGTGPMDLDRFRSGSGRSFGRP